MKGFALLLAGLSIVHASPASPTREQAEHHKRQNRDRFDYVIVGGGTAGLVLAERLSQNNANRVAVIEAGSYYQITNPALSSTPAGCAFWCGSDPEDSNPLVDWGFVTEPQAGGNGRRLHYARGKCLGGSSARNFMIYQRPSTGSLQQWADAVGDSSYTFANWLPFFKKSVQFTPPSSTRAANASTGFNAAAFDASGGPLKVSYANYASPFSSYIEGSMNEIGIPTTEDFNSGNLFGAQYCSSTIQPDQQRRDSSQTSFLDAANRRSNLQVYSVTKAKKIIFNGQKKATGVQVTTAGRTYTITATKEVILSAGAFQSPQLLMVSGIGPSDTLRRFNIPVLSNLAGVGQNMWDHIFMGRRMAMNQPVTPSGLLTCHLGPTYRVKVDTLTRLTNDLLYTGAQFAFDYSVLKRGPLTNPVADYLAWEKIPSALRGDFSTTTTSELSQFSSDWPEVEYVAAPGYVGDFSSLPQSQPSDGFQYASILAALVAPLSRGNVTITSADTDDLPLIDPAWLTSPSDQEVAIAGYKRVREAFASKAMRPVLADTKEFFPGPQVSSDAEILNTIRDTLMTVWHAACTCKMGQASDPTAVVDNRGRVFGVTGLRVVDASAAPLLPPGHPQSWIYALAEKIASHILNGD